MESINEVVRPMAGEKRQSFKVNMSPIAHELFVGNKVRVNQVLINLLSNAVKYTPEDGHIEFSVSDAGSSSTAFERIRFEDNAFVKDVQDALDAGMNAHIAKPINLETLKNSLGSCLRNRGC